MPQLLIMRHAKSDWGEPAAADHARPLAPRGVRAAKRMGRLLTDAGAAPDLVLTSTAVRARTTAELAAEAGVWSAPIEARGSLYGATAADVVTELAAANLPDRVMVVGHEPTSSELVALLSGGGRVRMPTAAVACIELTGSWADLAPGRGRLRWLVTPSLVKRAG